MYKIRATDTFTQWLDRLRDIHARARVLARIERLAGGNPGDVKPVNEGISEMRIDYGPAIGCITQNKTVQSSFCWQVEINAHKPGILKRLYRWRVTFE